MAKHAAPSGLGPKARKMWREITEEYDLRADERRVLEDACRELDLIEVMEKALADDVKAGNLTVRGSQGQPVANPMVSELRHHRGTLQRLLASLKLPDDKDEVKDRSTTARAAANARWKRGA